jgi:AraC-like DNA-binding protein
MAGIVLRGALSPRFAQSATGQACAGQKNGKNRVEGVRPCSRTSLSRWRTTQDSARSRRSSLPASTMPRSTPLEPYRNFFFDISNNQLGISSRQLQRRFVSAVGYGPKTFHSILRFQRLLSLSGRTSAPRSLARVSAEAGYADQAHMTREVQRFSGAPPTVTLSFARCALGLSDLVKKAGHAGC